MPVCCGHSLFFHSTLLSLSRTFLLPVSCLETLWIFLVQFRLVLLLILCVLLKFYDVRRHFEFEFWDHLKKFASSSIIPVPAQFPNFDLFSAGFEFLKPLGCLMTENCNFKEKLERGEYS